MSEQTGWGVSPRDLPERWPKAPDGTPEKPMLLMRLKDWNYEAEMLTEKLRAYGIPALRMFGHDGSFGKLVLGRSASGVELYVPEPMLEDARNLLEPVEDTDLNIDTPE